MTSSRLHLTVCQWECSQWRRLADVTGDVQITCSSIIHHNVFTSKHSVNILFKMSLYSPAVITITMRLLHLVSTKGRSNTADLVKSGLHQLGLLMTELSAHFIDCCIVHPKTFQTRHSKLSAESLSDTSGEQKTLLFIIIRDSKYKLD